MAKRSDQEQEQEKELADNEDFISRDDIDIEVM